MPSCIQDSDHFRLILTPPVGRGRALNLITLIHVIGMHQNRRLALFGSILGMCHLQDARFGWGEVKLLRLVDDLYTFLWGFPLFCGFHCFGFMW